MEPNSNFTITRREQDELQELRRLKELLSLWKANKIADLVVVYRQMDRVEMAQRGEL